MIAAVAITHGLELATGNISHYQRIQQLGYPLPWLTGGSSLRCASRLRRVLSASGAAPRNNLLVSVTHRLIAGVERTIFTLGREVT